MGSRPYSVVSEDIGSIYFSVIIGKIYTLKLKLFFGVYNSTCVPLTKK